MAQLTLLPYPQATRLLEAYGIPLVRSSLVREPGQAAQAARDLGFPVALKLVDPRASHKSDAGLLRLGLQNEDQVLRAAGELVQQAGTLQATSDSSEGLLVQEMVSGGVELLVGSSLDAQFGPVLALGAGGVWVELFDDLALRLPPLTQLMAQSMLDEIRAARLLRGYRGSPPVDLPALRQLLINLGRLVLDHASWLDSLDINPLMALPDGRGVKVVDFRIFCRAGCPEPANGGR